MNLLWYKLLFAPMLVGLATLAGRKWGHNAAGLVAGLPIVAGPILYFFALEQGPGYAASAALATLLGIVSLCLFIMAYAWRAALGGRPLSCVLLGWVAFAFGTVLMDKIQDRAELSLAKAFLWSAFALFLTLKSLPPSQEGSARPAPKGDLLWRMGAAALLVWGLTHFAQTLGPRLGGLLTPFPVASTVLAVFAHWQGGSGAAQDMLKGLTLALNAFAVFCVVLGVSLGRFGLPAAFGLAVAAALALQAALIYLGTRKKPSRS